jgi:hypothetical protein
MNLKLKMISTFLYLPSQGMALSHPYILNISDDVASCGRLLYMLDEATISVGSAPENPIRLLGLGVSPVLAAFKITKLDANQADGEGAPAKFHMSIVKYHPNHKGNNKGQGGNNSSGGSFGGSFGQHNPSDKNTPKANPGHSRILARVVVNGKELAPNAVQTLKHGDRIVFGRAFAFRLVMPGMAVADGRDGGSPIMMGVDAAKNPDGSNANGTVKLRMSEAVL